MIMHQALDVVHVYLNLFGPLCLQCTCGNIYWTLIITPNECGWIKCNSNFPKNTLQPHTLCNCVSCSFVIDLSWRKFWNILYSFKGNNVFVLCQKVSTILCKRVIHLTHIYMVLYLLLYSICPWYCIKRCYFGELYYPPLAICESNSSSSLSI